VTQQLVKVHGSQLTRWWRRYSVVCLCWWF